MHQYPTFMIKVFNRLISHVKRKHIFLFFCAIIVILVVSFFILGYAINQKKFDSQTFLEKLRATTINKDEFFADMRGQLREIIIAIGPSGAVKLTREAFAHGNINFVHCHTLMHIAGHIVMALQTKNGTSDNINIYDSDLCGFGYSHGLEAQIVLENPDPHDARNKLYDLCAALQVTSPGITCYEGAGHTFMSKTLNIESAIDLCDALSSDGPLRDPFMCYKGVFAEYTNLIGGNDTETGRQREGGPILTLPMDTPIAYCASLPNKYSLMCAHEVCGLHAANMTLALTEAVTGNYPIEMQAACVHNAAGAKAENELSHATTVAIPPIVFSLSKELRRQYIAGTIGEFNSYARSGAQKDWRSFCNVFTKEEDRVVCTDIVERK